MTSISREYNGKTYTINQRQDGSLSVLESGKLIFNISKEGIEYGTKTTKGFVMQFIIEILSKLFK